MKCNQYKNRILLLIPTAPLYNESLIINNNRINHHFNSKLSVKKYFSTKHGNDSNENVDKIAERYIRASSWTVADVLERIATDSGRSINDELSIRLIDERKSAYDAAKIMVESNSGSLIVIREEKDDERSKRRLIGILTERDYIRKIVLEDKKPKETAVSEIMTKSSMVKVVTPLHTVQEAMKLMKIHQFRNLPVVSPRRLENGELYILALISQRDLINYYIQYHEDSMEYLSSLIEFPIW